MAIREKYVKKFLNGNLKTFYFSTTSTTHRSTPCIRSSWRPTQRNKSPKRRRSEKKRGKRKQRKTKSRHRPTTRVRPTESGMTFGYLAVRRRVLWWPRNLTPSTTNPTSIRELRVRPRPCRRRCFGLRRHRRRRRSAPREVRCRLDTRLGVAFRGPTVRGLKARTSFRNPTKNRHPKSNDTG